MFRSPTLVVSHWERVSGGRTVRDRARSPWSRRLRLEAMSLPVLFTYSLAISLCEDRLTEDRVSKLVQNILHSYLGGLKVSNGSIQLLVPLATSQRSQRPVERPPRLHYLSVPKYISEYVRSYLCCLPMSKKPRRAHEHHHLRHRNSRSVWTDALAIQLYRQLMGLSESSERAPFLNS